MRALAGGQDLLQLVGSLPVGSLPSDAASLVEPTAATSPLGPSNPNASSASFANVSARATGMAEATAAAAAAATTAAAAAEEVYLNGPTAPLTLGRHEHPYIVVALHGFWSLVLFAVNLVLIIATGVLTFRLKGVAPAAEDYPHYFPSSGGTSGSTPSKRSGSRPRSKTALGVELVGTGLVSPSGRHNAVAGSAASGAFGRVGGDGSALLPPPPLLSIEPGTEQAALAEQRESLTSGLLPSDAPALRPPYVERRVRSEPLQRITGELGAASTAFQQAERRLARERSLISPV